ncbi:triose-phosphate isomerase [Candidatus Woesearchaeota archaeon]|nr:MAG: triose-phosphate isomerase [Candidatus Woesearchaeota archaeon]
MIVVNFKNYLKGKSVKVFAEKLKHKNLVLALPAINLLQVKGNVIAQHVDYCENEKSTGYVTAESLSAAGVKGTLINHAEHKLDPKMLGKTIKQCKMFKLKTFVCADSISEARKLLKHKPEYIAYEVPELISTGKSITNYPESVKKFIKLFKGVNTKPLIGAGITKLDDVLEAKRLGAKGVLVASAIVNSKNGLTLAKKMAGVKW